MTVEREAWQARRELGALLARARPMVARGKVDMGTSRSPVRWVRNVIALALLLIVVWTTAGYLALLDFVQRQQDRDDDA